MGQHINVMTDQPLGFIATPRSIVQLPRSQEDPNVVVVVVNIVDSCSCGCLLQ